LEISGSIPFEERACWCLHPSILNPLHNILGTHQVWHISPCETIYNYFCKHGFFHSQVPWNVYTSLSHRKSLEDTKWKTHFGNGHRLPLVTGNAPVTNQVLQISHER
jgi:hypothetical protein